MGQTLGALVARLHEALSKDDAARADALLRAVQLENFRAASEADWANFFSILVEAWRRPEPELADLALHWLGASFWLARISSGPIRYGVPSNFPIERFLSTARVYAERGPDNVYVLFDRMQSAFRHLEDAPRVLRRLFDGLTGWLQKLEPRDRRLPLARPGIIEAAQTAFLPMPAWPTACDLLMARARSDREDIARAAAAWRIGCFYLDAAEAGRRLEPALAQTARALSTLEVDRPGVAGPFLAAFFSELDAWRAAGGPEPKGWILDILERRRGSEPDTLPVALGIDYLTQEWLTSPEDIRRLAAIGRRDFAQVAAAEAGIDLTALLREAESE